MRNIAKFLLGEEALNYPGSDQHGKWFHEVVCDQHNSPNYWWRYWIRELTKSNFDDVSQLHSNFDFLVSSRPNKLTNDKMRERLELIAEEFLELVQASGFDLHIVLDPWGSIEKIEIKTSCEFIPSFVDQSDALIDITYVVMGTAVSMGLPWQELWDDVHRANLSKKVGVTKRGHKKDLVKPDNWIGPKTEEILLNNGYDPNQEGIDDYEVQKTDDI